MIARSREREYLGQHPNALRDSAFRDRYRVFRERRRLSMRQHHVAGDKMFVDYSGKKPHLVNASTGELMEVTTTAPPLCRRARTGRDKAKVEVAVKIAQRWILGRLRNRASHALAAPNAATRECIADLNARRIRANAPPPP